LVSSIAREKYDQLLRLSLSVMAEAQRRCGAVDMAKDDLDRRSVLRMLVASTGALAVTATGRARAAALDGVRVVVIGAGCAGLGAARLLHKQGAEVLVLEGKSHIGGRVRTDWSMGAPFESGAGWIHGPARANPVRQLCDAVGAEYHLFDDENGSFFTKDGAEFSDDLYEQVAYSWNDVIKHIEDNYELDDPRSLHEAIRAYDARLLNDPAVIWAFSAWTEFSSGGPIEDLSAALINADQGFDAPDVLLISGYDAMLKPLASGLNILLNQTVSSIAYSADGGVKIVTNRGVVEADYCICTVPLGVLQAGTIAFHPPLPESHSSRIKRLGFGSVSKLALKFEEPFWDVGTQYFGMITEPRGRWNYWLNYRSFSQENILVGFCVGNYATIADRMSRDEMIEDALPVLRRVWGVAVGAPIEALSTHWSADPHALGAYSYPRPGNAKRDYDGLAEGIEGRLFLAGEHTIFDHSGTTHGAYLSGLLAAESVMSTATRGR